METLTSTEEKIMHIIWRLEKAFVKDIIDSMSKPKPPYNTVSSVVRLLEKKKFVGHKAYGKTHEYFPLISKDEYSKKTFKSMLGNYFNGSYESLVSFMVQEENLSPDELKEIRKIINQKTK